ncbi:dienelactone hydrolase [Flavobacterium aquatile LMG 4008 = ATCC 11947]|uniref:Dienelactone hydrolase n=1 Tax=Flavobacterium aquatile LMG 4008 = ATCC 11947 TaxID=1453498 RepID=A0A095SSQ4_9FLAO|nr:dienelactone hydrolase [Flavobacterium aquatile LMG 4008 = ATCC 11947]
MVLFLFSNAIMAQLKSVDYADGNQKLSGFVAKPSKAIKDNPGILILPAWMGIDDHSKETADELAKLGYNTFVADIYGVGNKPSNSSEAGQKAGHFKKNILEYQARIQLALEQLVKQGANPDKIIVIGYCFGGTGAIEAARANMKVKGIVSFHGGLGRDESRTLNSINCKVLVLHGADDPFVPEAEIKSFQSEMRKSNADWQMVYYSNAVHAFTEKKAGNDNSKGAAYNENAAKRSWKAMLQFLDEVL